MHTETTVRLQMGEWFHINTAQIYEFSNWAWLLKLSGTHKAFYETIWKFHVFAPKASLFLKLLFHPLRYLTIHLDFKIFLLFIQHAPHFHPPQSTNLSYKTMFIPSQQMISFHTHILCLGPSPYKASTQWDFLQQKTSEISQADKKLRLDLAKHSQRHSQIGCFWFLVTPEIMFEPLCFYRSWTQRSKLLFLFQTHSLPQHHKSARQQLICSQQMLNQMLYSM